MKFILKYLFVLFPALSSFTALATWSIIVIDPKTNEIGIAGASCTHSVYGIGGIVPGKGAIIVQAMSNKAARDKGLQLIKANAAPEEILAVIKNPVYNPEEQQYAVVCINDLLHPSTYTGSECNSAMGSMTAKGISVQGNTLTNDGEIAAVLKAAVEAQHSGAAIEEILMKALEAGAEYGGDNRCGSRKASSAFLTVAKPTDNVNKPSLNLIVNQADETSNAVVLLRTKFDNLKAVNN
jgi:uncharacterized Ntn-hydrolase superfamily protein